MMHIILGAIIGLVLAGWSGLVAGIIVAVLVGWMKGRTIKMERV